MVQNSQLCEPKAPKNVVTFSDTQCSGLVKSHLHILPWGVFSSSVPSPNYFMDGKMMTLYYLGLQMIFMFISAKNLVFLFCSICYICLLKNLSSILVVNPPLFLWMQMIDMPSHAWWFLWFSLNKNWNWIKLVVSVQIILLFQHNKVNNLYNGTSMCNLAQLNITGNLWNMARVQN